MMIKSDLTSAADDKTVLSNPHKGWYWHYYDNGMKRPLYRDKHKPGETYHSFPGLNHLYLRIDWADVQPAPDVFDWSEIDRVMDEWSKEGYSFSFRVCCSETCEAQCFATPKWLYDMGCAGSFIPPTREENPKWWNTPFGDDSVEVFHRIVGNTYHRYWEPDYGDPLFLEYLERFLKNFAEKFDEDPRVEYIDLGSYGNWGEGHVCFGSRKSASIDTLKHHAYLHKKYFKRQHILMNDDFITHLYDCTQEEKDELLHWCISLGFGIRDDSIIAGAYEQRSYHTIDAVDFFDEMSVYAPADLELGHYWSYNRDNAKDGLVIMEAARRAHASFVGFHTYPQQWLEDNYYVTEYLANRLGYWFFLHSIQHNCEAYPGTCAILILEWENKGFAPCYHPFELDIKLTHISTGTSYLFSAENFNSQALLPNVCLIQPVKIRLEHSMSEGDYQISLRMREGRRFIALALNRELLDEAGFYQVSRLQIHAPLG